MGFNSWNSFREDKDDLRKLQDLEYNPFIDEVEEKWGLKFSKDTNLFETTLINEEEGQKILRDHLESLVSQPSSNLI